MSKILVCGLTNVETTVKVGSFPINYCPIEYNFFGVNSHPSGVGLNLSLAFSSLCDEVRLLSMVGDDSAGAVIKDELSKNGVSTDYLMKCSDTAQSVVLYDDDGKRRIYCDLKNIQDLSFDESIFENAVKDCDMLCLCNINFSRNLLFKAKEMGKRIATDVHVLCDINDEYNYDYIECADILFLSNENIIGREHEFLATLKDNCNAEIIVIGMGKQGSLMYVRSDDRIHMQSSVVTRDVVNTVGAGDALFSSFVHFYTKGVDPYRSLLYASYFASYKIGENGPSKGFLSENELLKLIN